MNSITRKQGVAGYAPTLAAIFFIALAFTSAAFAQNTYVITEEDNIFGFAAMNGETQVGTTGPIQTVINAIKTDAAGNPCTIQFEDGTATLDIGVDYITFDDDGAQAWGEITLAGKITSAHNNTSRGVIYLLNGASINSTANIANTASSNNAIYNDGYGAVNISGGTVSAPVNGGVAVYNNASGAVNISGGTISTTNGYAVYNNSTGAVNISGGTVSATIGNAVRNNSDGIITVSGTAMVTSASNGITGTISNRGQSGQLIIEGGTVRNTVADNGNAIYNGSTRAVIISGGTISATIGTAVYNNSTGAVNISGGTVSATTGRAVYTAVSGKITVSGDAMVTSAGATVTSTGLVNGTIFLGSNSSTAERLAIEGGTVKNTATGNAVYNNSGGAVNISGGTVSAITGSAVYNAVAGKITVSGDAVVTSANTGATNGTIYLASSGTATAERLSIEGGTVKNTAIGNAVYNGSTGAVTISDGLVAATTGYAVYKNNANATVTLTGGAIFAYGTAASNVLYGTVDASSGNTAIIAWNKPTDTPTYAISSNTALLAWPSTATARWNNNDGKAGIEYANGANTGFIPIDGVTVGDTYPLTVVNGIGSSSYEAGEEVEITADIPPEGKAFSKWTSMDGITFDNETAESTTFTMPAKAVTVTAIYIDLPPGEYAISVENSGHGIANASATHATAGTEITLTAEANEGYVFKEWEVVSGGVTIANNKFTMPANNVVVMAVFEAEEETPIRLPQIASSNIHAYATGNSIVLQNLPAGAKVEVFGLNGKRIYSAHPENPLIGGIGVQTKGMYIVKITTKGVSHTPNVFRVVVK
ncbi:MAG: hypothetical protein LBH25_09950 [Fibromonadaceae bacterium]|jgi:hypothetical protein|nr:hypothetical protein [Fibromonadaceae bacterium]